MKRCGTTGVFPDRLGTAESTKINRRTAALPAFAIAGSSKPPPLCPTSTIGPRWFPSRSRTVLTQYHQCGTGASATPSSDGTRTSCPRRWSSRETGRHVLGPTRGLCTRTNTMAMTPQRRFIMSRLQQFIWLERPTPWGPPLPGQTCSSAALTGQRLKTRTGYAS